MRERKTGARRGALRLVTLIATVGAGLGLVACGGSDSGNSGGGSGGGGGGGGGDQFTSSGFQDALDAVSDKEGTSDFSLLKVQITEGGTEFQIRDGERARGYVYTTDGDLTDEEVQIIGPGSLQGQDFPFGEVDSAAIDKIVPAVKDQVGAGDAQVTVMTLEKGITNGELKWTINAEGGGRAGLVYTADPDGSNVGNPASAALEQTKKAAKQAQPALDVAKCIQQAGGDVQAIQDCAQ